MHIDAPDIDSILQDIGTQVRDDYGRGHVARYIPALAAVPADRFGMAVVAVDGTEYVVGDADTAFSVQSISKVFTLSMALRAQGSRLWQRVGREPSGNPFNSLVQLEYEHGIPRNPFINAGAHVVTDIVAQAESDPKAAILSELRQLAGNPEIDFDRDVALSEHTSGHLNRAIAHFLKAQGNLVGDVDAVLDVYFHQCALAMSCRDLARAACFLANGGVNPRSGNLVVGPRRARRINALMMTCGLYDAVGNFAFRVGIPAKSGVGGGMLGIVPGRYSICVWSPALDERGNSVAGTHALELFTSQAGISVF